MDDSARARDSAAGWVAIALGIVIVATLVVLLVFFIVGGPFGPINDAGNALIGVLSAVLAVMLAPRAGRPAGVIAAVIGAVVGVWGSWLVMTGTTGFILAGFVSTIGFGLIGVWLALVAWSPMADGWPSRLRRLARLSAAFMVIGGIAAIPSALMGIDDFADVPGWLWLYGLGWLGTYLLYPVWSLSFGRLLTGDRSRS